LTELRAGGTTERDNRFNLRLWDHAKPHDGGGKGGKSGLGQDTNRQGLPAIVSGFG